MFFLSQVHDLPDFWELPGLTRAPQLRTPASNDLPAPPLVSAALEGCSGPEQRADPPLSSLGPGSVLPGALVPMLLLRCDGVSGSHLLPVLECPALPQVLALLTPALNTVTTENPPPPDLLLVGNLPYPGGAVVRACLTCSHPTRSPGLKYTVMGGDSHSKRRTQGAWSVLEAALPAGRGVRAACFKSFSL